VASYVAHVLDLRGCCNKCNFRSMNVTYELQFHVLYTERLFKHRYIRKVSYCVVRMAIILWSMNHDSLNVY
jgi:hypothetical protein